MAALRIGFLTVLVVLMLAGLSSVVTVCVFGADSSEAVATIAAAEARIIVCYDAVVEADDAGANVSGLTATLDEAGVFLSLAELAYTVGDFDSAVGNASLSQGLLHGFVAEAEALTEEAVQAYSWDFSVNVVGSSVGAGVVVCGGFAAWFLLKKKQGGGAGE